MVEAKFVYALRCIDTFNSFVLPSGSHENKFCDFLSVSLAHKALSKGGMFYS